MTKEEAYEFINKFPRCHGCDDDSYPLGCDECDDAFYTALNALKQQEAVGWIKVSDRLPFSSQMVLVSYPAYTDEAGNQYVEGVGIGYLITTATNKYWCRSDGTTFGELGFSSVNPIAWMPIPSPMKGGEQDE